jgi:hypothetical protein
VIIRELEAKDEAQWWPLWQGYCDFHEVALPCSMAQRTWSLLVDPASMVSGRVAETPAGLIGFAHHVVHPATWTATDACYLADPFVRHRIPLA